MLLLFCLAVDSFLAAIDMPKKSQVSEMLQFTTDVALEPKMKQTG